MKIFKNIIENFLYLGIGQGVSGLLYFLATVYLARKLGAEKFGIFSFAESVFLFFSLLVIFGSDVVGAREIAQADYKDRSDIVSTLIGMRIISSIVSFLILIIFIIAIRNPLETKLFLFICGLGLFSFIFLLDWFYWGLEKFNIYATYMIIRDLVFLLGVLISVNFKNNILLVGVIFLFSKFLYSLLLFISSTKLNLIFKPRLGLLECKKMIFSCNAIFWATFIGWIVHYFDIILIAMLYEKKVVGYYSAAYKPIFYIFMIVVVYLKAIFPVLSKVDKYNPHYFKKILGLTLLSIILVFLPLGLLFNLFSRDIIIFMYGKNYLPCIDSFKVLAFALLVMSINTTYSQGIIATSREQQNLKINLFIGTSNIFLNILLIPFCGIVGAAWSKLCAQIFGFLYYRKELILS